MLPHFSQYSPFGLQQPFPGMQGFGGMPGVGQSPGFGGAGAYGQSPYAHHQATNSFFSQPGASYMQPGQPGGTFSTALQIIPLIGHLAQQVHLQSGVTQQIGMALSHLAQQLTVLSQQVMLSQQTQGGIGLGFGAGQGIGQPNWQNAQYTQFGGGAQPLGFGPFAGAAGLGGQTPQWAAQRSQTIQ